MQRHPEVRWCFEFMNTGLCIPLGYVEDGDLIFDTHMSLQVDYEYYQE